MTMTKDFEVSIMTLISFFFLNYVNLFLLTVNKYIIRITVWKCPNTEFFLVCIFPHSDWIRRDTSYLSVFSPNAEKYIPGKTPYLDIFHAVNNGNNNNNNIKKFLERHFCRISIDSFSKINLPLLKKNRNCIKRL